MDFPDAFRFPTAFAASDVRNLSEKQKRNERLTFCCQKKKTPRVASGNLRLRETKFTGLFALKAPWYYEKKTLYKPQTVIKTACGKQQS